MAILNHSFFLSKNKSSHILKSEFLINKVLDVKPLLPYLSEYANSLTQKLGQTHFFIDWQQTKSKKIWKSIPKLQFFMVKSSQDNNQALERSILRLWNTWKVKKNILENFCKHLIDMMFSQKKFFLFLDMQFRLTPIFLACLILPK